MIIYSNSSDINQDYDLLSSCLSSPISTHSEKFEPQIMSEVKIEPEEVFAQKQPLSQQFQSATPKVQTAPTSQIKPVRQTKREIQRPQKFNDSAPIKTTKNSRNTSVNGRNATQNNNNGNNTHINSCNNNKNKKSNYSTIHSLFSVSVLWRKMLFL